jgi:hypothetical protein
MEGMFSLQGKMKGGAVLLVAELFVYIPELALTVMFKE